jgi:selenocysteine lyase/cysteine desulfurase
VDSLAIDQAFRKDAIITTVRHGWLRVAVHYFNDESEIDRLLAVLKGLVKVH